MRTTTQEIEVIIIDDDDDAQAPPQQVFTTQEVTAYIKNESGTAQAVRRTPTRLWRTPLLTRFCRTPLLGWSQGKPNKSSD